MAVIVVIEIRSHRIFLGISIFKPGNGNVRVSGDVERSMVAFTRVWFSECLTRDSPPSDQSL